MKTVSAAEANRHFSKILREVRAGRTVLVTSRANPWPRSSHERRQARRPEALKRLFDRLDAQPALDLPRMSRDEFYDD